MSRLSGEDRADGESWSPPEPELEPEAELESALAQSLTHVRGLAGISKAWTKWQRVPYGHVPPFSMKPRHSCVLYRACRERRRISSTPCANAQSYP